MCKINFKMPVFPEGITDAERRSIMFEALSALDLSSLVEKRENLTYLSWANCFSVLKQIYPLATYRVIKNPATGLPFFTDPAVGIFVYTEVEIEGITTECFLPVMDNKNKAMKLEPYTYQVWDNYKKVYVDKTVNGATSFDINRPCCLPKFLLCKSEICAIINPSNSVGIRSLITFDRLTVRSLFCQMQNISAAAARAAAPASHFFFLIILSPCS